jgi:REP element-mobilizing transposase RayT
MRQLCLPEARTWGGKRRGAGRPRQSSPSAPDHLARPDHDERHPVHVVLRVRSDVPRLRTAAGYRVIRSAMQHANTRTAFRIAHASIQHNHIHLIVESADSSVLSRGVQAFAISTARGLNRIHGRRGSVFAFRYHATTITCPRQMRSVLSYVLNNWRHHHEDRQCARARAAILDPYSTAVSLDGWLGHGSFRPPRDFVPLPVARPRTWLLATGWRRCGALDPFAVPG